MTKEISAIYKKNMYKQQLNSSNPRNNISKLIMKDK